MDRRNSLRSFLIVLALFAGWGMAACSGGGDDDDSTGATATPEPSPTPEPIDDTFRIIGMEVGGSDVGVDIDGDGTIDNGIESTMDAVVQSTVDSVTQALRDAGVQESTIAIVETALTEALSSVFTVDALTAALNGPIESFQVNYMLEFASQVDGTVALNWYNADMQAGGSFEVDTSRPESTLGTQSGTLDLTTGDGNFAGDITLKFVFDLPTGPGQEPLSITNELTLLGAKTTVSQYNDAKLRDTMFGGALSLGDIMSIVQGVLDFVAGNLPETVPFDPDAYAAQIESALANYTDIQVDGEDAFSIGLNLSADASLLIVK